MLSRYYFVFAYYMVLYKMNKTKRKSMCCYKSTLVGVFHLRVLFQFACLRASIYSVILNCKAERILTYMILKRRQTKASR